MSDEIIDVDAQTVSTGGEIKTPNGMNIPDEEVIEEIDTESHDKIVARREEVNAMLPEYPREWQENVEEESTEESSEESPQVNVSIKEKEMKKIIKKYKRYMKSNLKEIRRVDY